jgi:ArsR family transcriptional regulator, arsenate/arsenite/antimonite-responsive transcriptional repressor
MNIKKLSKFFRAICDEHRLHILTLLQDKGKMKVTDIVNATNISQPTVSHHLKILYEANVVESEKKGKEIFYSAKSSVIDQCCCKFKDHFCDQSSN